MQRRSDDLRQLRLVFIGDGAEWIWRRVADIGNADSVHILDFCHAVDHLAEVCKVLYGQGTEQFDKQLQQWRDRLREGGAAVIDELRQLRDADRDHGDDIQGEINYFEANRERINYQQSERTTCRSAAAPWRALQERRRRADEGQRHGTLEGAQHMLQLRASPRYANATNSHYPNMPNCWRLHDSQNGVAPVRLGLDRPEPEEGDGLLAPRPIRVIATATGFAPVACFFDENPP